VSGIMAIKTIDPMTTAWTSNAPAAWSLAISAQAAAVGPDGLGMSIAAQPDPGLLSPPQAQRGFAPTLDLTGFDEIRLWFRSDRVSDGSTANPFYVAFEAAPAEASPAQWSRFLPVSRSGAWELHRLWLGDMPPALTSAIGALRLRGLATTATFNAALDDIVAVSAQAVADVEAGWSARLDGALSVMVGGVATPAPLYLEPPAAPPAAPYILLTAWAALALQDFDSSAQVTDNYTIAGAYMRPAPATVRLDYRLQVVATDRGQRAALLGALIANLQASPFLLVADQKIAIEPFELSPQERASLIPPDTMPLFYRLLQTVEIGTRTLYPMARARLTIGQPGGQATAETTAV
jgi:hypothetical protein